MRRTAGAVLAGAVILIVPGGTSSAEADSPSSWTVGASGTAAARSGDPPPSPTGVSAGCIVPAGRVVIAWRAVAGADSYVVSQTTSSSGSNQTNNVTSDTSIPVNLALAGTYSFTVRSRSGPNWIGPPSSAVGVTLTSALLCA